MVKVNHEYKKANGNLPSRFWSWPGSNPALWEKDLDIGLRPHCRQHSASQVLHTQSGRPCTQVELEIEETEKLKKKRLKFRQFLLFQNGVISNESKVQNYTIIGTKNANMKTKMKLFAIMEPFSITSSLCKLCNIKWNLIWLMVRQKGPHHNKYRCFTWCRHLSNLLDAYTFLGNVDDGQLTFLAKTNLKKEKSI